ncbi:hypothetical protein Ddc_17209 [Ditylenchus destructor]|nr:hypothetical protein Ddc_17209 [Ditylenchus destructor]
MSHRNLENPGFSHGHNWLCATVFQASDGSFCSSHRAEQTGKVSAPIRLRRVSYESPQSRESRIFPRSQLALRHHGAPPDRGEGRGAPSCK